jgi:glycosyltransferase involved in cell wall biosynthesis
LRVAFDIAEVSRGGAERQVLEVATGLQERGHDVLLIVNKHVRHYVGYFDLVPITELHRSWRLDARVALDIRRSLLRYRPDVCVCVNFNASLWGRLAAASAGCRVVVAEHATTVPPLAVRVTNRALNGVTDSVIACAEAQVESLIRGGHDLRKITVVRNGVDVDRFAPDGAGAAAVRAELGIPSEDPVVVLVAAHRLEKRHDRFIALVERLHETGTRAWGVMVGGGLLLERTSSMAKASEVAEWLLVAGPRNDMPAVYSAADVVVLVSDDVETFPLSFLEAQACGVPVVGLDTGGVRETMVEGHTGFTVGRDDLASMTSIVASLLADGDRRENMGRAGRDFVARELSRSAMIDGYERALEKRRR